MRLTNADDLSSLKIALIEYGFYTFNAADKVIVRARDCIARGYIDPETYLREQFNLSPNRDLVHDLTH